MLLFSRSHCSWLISVIPLSVVWRVLMFLTWWHQFRLPQGFNITARRNSGGLLTTGKAIGEPNRPIREWALQGRKLASSTATLRSQNP